MFKPAVILACGLAVLAGCTTTSHQRAKSQRDVGDIPPDWELSPTNKSAIAQTPSAGAPTQENITPITSPTNAVSAPETKWLALNRWRQQRGLGELHRLGVKPLDSFALPTSNGVLIVTIGSRTAYWDGMELRLGFAPQMIGGEPFVHALDVRKNLEPLLRGFEAPAKSNRTIVIDPGHGGSNPGTRSVVDGGLEKEFTLDWARRLAPLLEENGWRVFMTRANDTAVSLAERVAFADQHHADLFLSLHFNSLENNGSDPAGLETYCLTPSGMNSTITRGYGDETWQVFPNNAFDEKNLQYAVQLHRALLTVNGGVDRGVRRARFPDVLRGQRQPSVLIEGGYLSNPKEARQIADPAYRQKLAEAIAKALE